MKLRVKKALDQQNEIIPIESTVEFEWRIKHFESTRRKEWKIIKTESIIEFEWNYNQWKHYWCWMKLYLEKVL